MKSTGRRSEVGRESHLGIISHDPSLLGYVLTVSGFLCLHKSYGYYRFRYLLLFLLLLETEVTLVQLAFS